MPTSNENMAEKTNAEITWRIEPGLRSAKNPTRVYEQKRQSCQKEAVLVARGAGPAGEGVGGRAVVAHKLLPRLDQLPPHSTGRSAGESDHYAEGTADRWFDMAHSGGYSMV